MAARAVSPFSSRTDPLDLAWRVGASPSTLAVLGLLLGALIAVTILVPQLPEELRDQPVAASRWKTQTAYSLPAGDLLLSLNLLDLYHAWPVGLLTALFGFCVALHAAEVLLSWRTLKRISAASELDSEGVPEHLRPLADLRTLQPALAIDERLQQELREENTEVQSGTRGPITTFVAARPGTGGFGALLFYPGLALCLVTLALSAWLAWRTPIVTLPPGETIRLADTGLSLRLTPHGQLVIEDAQGQSQTHQVPSRGPINTGRFALFLRPGGPAMTVQAVDAAGDTLALRPLDLAGAARDQLTLTFTQPQEEQGFVVGERELVFRVVSMPEPTAQRFLVQVFGPDAEEPIYNDFVVDEGSIQLGGDRYQIQTGYFASGQAVYNPIWWLWPIGGILMIVGVTISLLPTSFRLWLRVVPLANGSQVVVAGLSAGLMAAWSDLLARLAGCLDGEDTTTRAYWVNLALLGALTICTAILVGLGMWNLWTQGLIWRRTAMANLILALWLLIFGFVHLRSQSTLQPVTGKAEAT